MSGNDRYTDPSVIPEYRKADFSALSARARASKTVCVTAAFVIDNCALLERKRHLRGAR